MAGSLLRALAVLLLAARLAALTVDDPGTFVVDRAGVFTHDVARREATEALLKQLESKTAGRQ
jgi:hypothetical protein